MLLISLLVLACQRQYIGKTDRCILTCSNEPTADYPLH